MVLLDDLVRVSFRVSLGFAQGQLRVRVSLNEP